MIVRATQCGCDDCDCASPASSSSSRGGGFGSWYDYLNPITATKKIGNSIVDAAGEVALNVANRVDTFAKKTLETTLASGAAVRKLSSSSTPANPDDLPEVSYVPLAIGGVAAAGLLFWAFKGRKKGAHHP